MKIGFLIKITNSTSETQTVNLFTVLPPNGVEVRSLDWVFDFESLQKIATAKGFIGNSITSDFNGPLNVTIVKGQTSEEIEFTGRYEKEEIEVDGQKNSLFVICPPNSSFTFRLFTISL
jgi:hypothetical protein